MKKLIVALLVGGLAWAGYQKYTSLTARPSPATAPRIAPPASQPMPLTEHSTAAPAFACDGRMHCSQMRSCEEATFFLQHCPGTEMDGDNDGLPCERQWCS